MEVAQSDIFKQAIASEERQSQIKQRWNEIYSSRTSVMGYNANDFLSAELDKLPPGKLLLPGEGEGRNAIHAAKKGWSVDAFDISNQGRDIAISRASRHGVHINYWLDEFSTGTLKKCHYDAIGIVDVFPLPVARRQGLQQMLDSLRPGGLLILECFSLNNLQVTGGMSGRIECDRLYTTRTLSEELAAMKILTLKEEQVTRRELTIYPASVVRLVAQKWTN
jgi:SAM-dependent methyltransferase